MTGGNREAARLTGIPVNRYRTYAYMISGVFAAIGGIMLASRIGTGQVSAGAPLLMDGVAASLYWFFSVWCRQTECDRDIFRSDFYRRVVERTDDDERSLLCARYIEGKYFGWSLGFVAFAKEEIEGLKHESEFEYYQIL